MVEMKHAGKFNVDAFEKKIKDALHVDEATMQEYRKIYGRFESMSEQERRYLREEHKKIKGEEECVLLGDISTIRNAPEIGDNGFVEYVSEHVRRNERHFDECPVYKTFYQEKLRKG